MYRVVAVLGSSLPLAFSPLAIAATTSDPVVVTATRTAVTADDALASVTVITRNDIERMQARTIEDLLRGETGIAVSNNGGPGKFTSTFVRGTESDHVLVLVNGIKIGSATLGTAALQDIPVEQIERIEIVRGPRSSLYGSEAIGGVIQIFTRKGGGVLQPYFSVGGGSRATYSGLVGVSGGGERGWFNVSANHLDTDGINACDGILDVAGCFTNEPDKDGYRNTAGSVRAGHRFANGTELDAFWMRAKAKSGFDQADGFDPITFQSIENGSNETRVTQQVVGASLKASAAPNWDLTIRAGQNRDDSDNFRSGGVFDSRFDTKRNILSFQNDLSLATRQALTLGADYQDDMISSSVAYPVTERDNTGLFAQYQGGFAAHDLQASLRRDDNEQFGEHTTGGAAWGSDMGGGYRALLSYGTAFKAPTFNELYYPNFGNPNLRPEKSKSIEAGLRAKHDANGWALNVFQTDVNDLIAFDASFVPTNIASARIRGLEASLGRRVAQWNFETGLTLLDPENRSSGSNNGNVLPRRAQQALRLDVDRGMGPWRFGALLRAEGRRYDDLANTRRLGGYATLDLRTEYALAKAWLMQARIENALDKDYQTAEFFNQPGRGFFFTLHYQP